MARPISRNQFVSMPMLWQSELIYFWPPFYIYLKHWQKFDFVFPSVSKLYPNRTRMLCWFTTLPRLIIIGKTKQWNIFPTEIIRNLGSYPNIFFSFSKMEMFFFSESFLLFWMYFYLPKFDATPLLFFKLKMENRFRRKFLCEIIFFFWKLVKKGDLKFVDRPYL